MRNRISRATLASIPGLPADVAATCQRILALRDDMHAWLSTNPELDASVWYALWGTTRPEADVAQGLVGRTLDAAQRNVVITKENRVGVLRIFVAHNELTLEEQKLLSGKANAAAALLEQPWLEQSLRKPLAKKVGGLALLREIALSPAGVFSDDELVELVGTYPTWASSSSDLRRGAKDRNRFLRILFGRRPALIGPVLDAVIGTGSTPNRTLGRHEQDILTSIAGSAHLDGDAAARIAGMDDGNSTLTRADLDALHYCLLALVNNPRCPRDVVEAVGNAATAQRSNGAYVYQDVVRRRNERPEITGSFTEITDTETLGWLVRRSLPYHGQESSRPARPVELIELAKNPNLTPEQLDSLRGAIEREVEGELIAQDVELLGVLWPEGGQPSAETTPTRHHPGTPPQVQEAFTLGVERLGNDPVRWETLIGLLDDYDGTFEELVALSEAL